MRPLSELKSLSYFDLTADEIERLRQGDPAAYKAATDTIDAEAAAKPGEIKKTVINGMEVEVESITFRNGRRV